MTTVFFTLYHEANDFMVIQHLSVTVILFMNAYVVFTMLSLLIRVSGPEVKYFKGMLTKYFGV